MINRKKKNRGQSILEYSVYIMIVIAAFITMQNYFKRGLQGRWKQAVDDLGEQYDPRSAESNIVHRMSGTKNTIVRVSEDSDGGMISNRIDSESTKDTKEGYLLLPD